MSKVRLRETGQNRPDGSAPAQPIPPLRISGVVVHKDALIATLGALVPGLSDISVTDDGEFFWLMIAPAQGGTGDDPAAR